MNVLLLWVAIGFLIVLTGIGLRILRRVEALVQGDVQQNSRTEKFAEAMHRELILQKGYANLSRAHMEETVKAAAEVKAAVQPLAAFNPLTDSVSKLPPPP